MQWNIPDMTRRSHRAYLMTMTVVGLGLAAATGWYGCDYYITPVTARNVHEGHALFSPSGLIGHGLGFIGTFLMMIGVATYSLRKRWTRLRSVGRITHVLELHIFLCLLGPALVVYHTAFKFGGLVGVSFWCMVFVVASGVVGRYLYLQIPKSVLGHDLTFPELKRRRENLTTQLQTEFGVSESTIAAVDQASGLSESNGAISFLSLPKIILSDTRRRWRLRHVLIEIDRAHALPVRHTEARQVFIERFVIGRQMNMLERSQQLFRLWHMIHLPFTAMMFLILIGHVVTAFLFGYDWLFTK